MGQSDPWTTLFHSAPRPGSLGTTRHKATVRCLCVRSWRARPTWTWSGVCVFAVGGRVLPGHTSRWRRHPLHSAPCPSSLGTTRHKATVRCLCVCVQLAGASYLDIHGAGGGIHYTVRHVQAASEQQLTADLVQHARRMTRAGNVAWRRSHMGNASVPIQLAQCRFYSSR